MPSLKNLIVVITRPAHQAQELNQKIKELGGEVIPYPTIEILDAHDQIALKTAINKLDQQDVAIFISPNAVLKTIPHLPTRWPKHVKIAAVGAGTMKILLQHHLPTDIYPYEQFNSEALLALPELQHIRGKKIILFRGNGGRELLGNTLQQRGAILTQITAYQRSIPKNSGKLDNKFDIIVCTSNTGLYNLVKMVGTENLNWILNKQLLVISSRMAKFATELGFVKLPLIADNATNKAIIQTLISWREQ